MAVKTEEGKWLSKLTGDTWDSYDVAHADDITFLAKAIKTSIKERTEYVELLRQLEHTCRRLQYMREKEAYEKHHGALIKVGTLNVGDKFYRQSEIVPRTIMSKSQEFFQIYDSSGLMWDFDMIVESYEEKNENI